MSCPICTHPKREAIDASLDAGLRLAMIARQRRVTVESLEQHLRERSGAVPEPSTPEQSASLDVMSASHIPRERSTNGHMPVTPPHTALLRSLIADDDADDAPGDALTVLRRIRPDLREAFRLAGEDIDLLQQLMEALNQMVSDVMPVLSKRRGQTWVEPA
jgi:hypothetical protein